MAYDYVYLESLGLFVYPEWEIYEYKSQSFV